MYKFLTKNGQALSFGTGLAITVLFLLIATAGLSKFNALPKEEQLSTTIFDFGLMGALALVVVATIATIGFAVLQIASNLRSSLMGILGVVALVVIFLISYATASGEATGAIARAAENAGGLTAGNLKFIGASITTALILLGLAALIFIVSEIRNFFK